MKVSAPTQEELIALGRAMLRVLEQPGRVFCMDVVHPRGEKKPIHYHVTAVRADGKGGTNDVRH